MVFNPTRRYHSNGSRSSVSSRKDGRRFFSRTNIPLVIVGCVVGVAVLLASWGALRYLYRRAKPAESAEEEGEMEEEEEESISLRRLEERERLAGLPQNGVGGDDDQPPSYGEVVRGAQQQHNQG